MRARSKWITIPSWMMILMLIFGPTQVWAEGYSTEAGEDAVQEFTTDSSAPGGLDAETAESALAVLGALGPRYLDFVNDTTLLATIPLAASGFIARVALPLPSVPAEIVDYFTTVVNPAGIGLRGATAVVANAGTTTFSIFSAVGAAAGAPIALDPAAAPGTVTTGVPAGSSPWGVAFSPVVGDNVVYATNRGGAGALDGLMTFSIVAFVTVLNNADPAFIDPTDIQITNSGLFGYISNWGAAPVAAGIFIVTLGAAAGSGAVNKFTTATPAAPPDGTVILPAGTQRCWGLTLTPTRCWAFAHSGTINSITTAGGSADLAGAPILALPAPLSPGVPGLALGTPLWDGAFDFISGGKVFISAGVDAVAAPGEGPGPDPVAIEPHWILRVLVDAAGDPTAGSGTFVTPAAGDEDSFYRDVGIRPPPPPVGGVGGRSSGGHGCYVSNVTEGLDAGTAGLLFALLALGAAGVLFRRRPSRDREPHRA